MGDICFLLQVLAESVHSLSPHLQEDNYTSPAQKIFQDIKNSSTLQIQVRLRGGRLLVTAGSKVTVHSISLTGSSRLTHMVTGHTRDVLCLDLAGEGDLLVSGGLDTNVLVTRLGADQQFQLLHKLSGAWRNIL